MTEFDPKLFKKLLLLFGVIFGSLILMSLPSIDSESVKFNGEYVENVFKARLFVATFFILSWLFCTVVTNMLVLTKRERNQ